MTNTRILLASMTMSLILLSQASAQTTAGQPSTQSPKTTPTQPKSMTPQPGMPDNTPPAAGQPGKRFQAGESGSSIINRPHQYTNDPSMWTNRSNAFTNHPSQWTNRPGVSMNRTN